MGGYKSLEGANIFTYQFNTFSNFESLFFFFCKHIVQQAVKCSKNHVFFRHAGSIGNDGVAGSQRFESRAQGQRRQVSTHNQVLGNAISIPIINC